MFVLLKFRMRFKARQFVLWFDKHLPFRARYVENNESTGHWSPWAAITAAKNWKADAESDWECDCGRFEVRVFGFVVRVVE